MAAPPATTFLAAACSAAELAAACGGADLEGCTVLPSGPHLTLYNGEAYTEDGDSLSRARVERMVEYAGKKGLTVEGVPFGETICRWPRLFGEGSKVLHRLCVPVHR